MHSQDRRSLSTCRATPKLPAARADSKAAMKVALVVSCALIVLVLVEHVRWKLLNAENDRDDTGDLSDSGEHPTPR